MTNEMKIITLTARKNLLAARDAMGNANLIHKIDRKIRKLGEQK